jgi:hypothetical protein
LGYRKGELAGCAVSGKIFISYRREDSAPHALSIGQYLEHEFGRRNVFIDVDMYAGAKFPVVLEQRLAACKVMLVLIGPRWLNAIDDDSHLRLDNPEDWVRLEVASALKRSITVIPVRVGGAELPKKSFLPQDMRGLLDHQATTVSTTGFRNEMAGLVRDIRTIPGQKYQRTAFAVGAFCVVAMLLSGLWTFRDRWLSALQSQDKPPLADNKSYSEKAYPALRPGPEWVLFGVPTAGYLMYFKPESIRAFPNRVAVMVRTRVDPTKPVANGELLERAAYQEYQQVVECNSDRMVVAKAIIFDASGQPIYSYKWGDPEFVDLSIGTRAQPGTVGEALKSLMCIPGLKAAYISGQELSDMQFIPLSSTVDGKAEVFYRPEQLTDAGAVAALVVVRMIKEQPIASILPTGSTDTTSSTYKYSVEKITLDCTARTFTAPKVEYYGSNSTLNFVALTQNLNASGVAEKSPIDPLRQLMCTPKEVEKCEPILPPSGDELSGIYLGIIGEPGSDSEKVIVQVKLARNGNSVAGAYYRDGVCGSVAGNVDPGGTFLFRWSWNGNEGRGRAVFANDVLTASSGFGEEEEGGGSLTLFRISPNRGDPTRSTAEQSMQR